MPAARVVHFPERMRTKFKNGVLHNEQQPQRIVNGFIGQGEFEAMKSLSGWEAARCDEHPFRAKVFELSLLDKWSEQRIIRRRKMALLLPHTFLFNCLPRGFWPLL